jgi:hypothetical protein
MSPLYYITALPRKLPASGRVLVHNRVHAQWEDQHPGAYGFRAWTMPQHELTDNMAPCACGWSGLPHFRATTQPDDYGPRPNVKGKRCIADVVPAKGRPRAPVSRA